MQMETLLTTIISDSNGILYLLLASGPIISFLVLYIAYKVGREAITLLVSVLKEISDSINGLKSTMKDTSARLEHVEEDVDDIKNTLHRDKL